MKFTEWFNKDLHSDSSEEEENDWEVMKEVLKKLKEKFLKAKKELQSVSDINIEKRCEVVLNKNNPSNIEELRKLLSEGEEDFWPFLEKSIKKVSDLRGALVLIYEAIKCLEKEKEEIIKEYQETLYELRQKVRRAKMLFPKETKGIIMPTY